MTTFVLPSSLPVNMRTTGHGVARSRELGAFVGVFLVPQLADHIGLRDCSTSPEVPQYWAFCSPTSSRDRRAITRRDFLVRAITYPAEAAPAQVRSASALTE